MTVHIQESWKRYLKDEFGKAYFKELTEFVKNEYKKTVIYPHPKNIFKAFDECKFEDVKVVILGQDPYHGRGQANGLCFSVCEGIRKPPSLQNIFKEIMMDIRCPSFLEGKGDLSGWARQGVLLLNSTLTVRAGVAGSHQGKGWEQFTTAVIKLLSEEKENLVFILWGNYARKKGDIIDRSRHLVLEATHPSPFSAHNGFFGCKHFSKANLFLKKHNKDEIIW